MTPEAEKFNGWAAMLGFVAIRCITSNLQPTGQMEFSKPLTITMQPSNKTILERSIGRPAMMAFVLLTGIYLTTGQLIPGVV